MTPLVSSTKGTTSASRTIQARITVVFLLVIRRPNLSNIFDFLFAIKVTSVIAVIAIGEMIELYNK
jgi:hypothetical protein